MGNTNTVVSRVPTGAAHFCCQQKPCHHDMFFSFFFLVAVMAESSTPRNDDGNKKTKKKRHPHRRPYFSPPGETSEVKRPSARGALIVADLCSQQPGAASFSIPKLLQTNESRCLVEESRRDRGNRVLVLNKTKAHGTDTRERKPISAGSGAAHVENRNYGSATICIVVCEERRVGRN